MYFNITDHIFIVEANKEIQNDNKPGNWHVCVIYMFSETCTLKNMQRSFSRGFLSLTIPKKYIDMGTHNNADVDSDTDTDVNIDADTNEDTDTETDDNTDTDADLTLNCEEGLTVLKVVFSDISERNNDYSDTFEFRRRRVSEAGLNTFSILEVPDHKSALLI